MEVRESSGTEGSGSEGSSSEGSEGAGAEVCRLCARGGVLISLFDNEAALRLCEKVAAVAGVRVARGDGLPALVCAACSAELERAFAFRARVQRADRRLRARAGLHLHTHPHRATELVLVPMPGGTDSGSGPGAPRRRAPRRYADFVALDASSERDEPEPRKRTRRRRKARPAPGPDADGDFDSSDDVILVNAPPKKRKSPPTPAGKYPCPHCDKSFPYPSVLKLHSVTHTKEKTHKCLMCPETFLYSRSLYAHYKEVHPDESTKPTEEPQKSFPCGMCDKVFNQSKNLKVHEAMHLREKKYRCEGCSLGFTNMSILTAHKKREHPFLFQSLSCNYCNRNFKKKSSLERHLDNHRQLTATNTTETKKPPLMKDLFKSIAPMTTTYWSDSFSD